MRKPLSVCCGGFHTDSNFDTIQLSLTQVNKIARDKFKKAKKEGCKHWAVIDCKTHWAISIH